MANPFKTKFVSNCQSCGETCFENDLMFAVDGMFVCEECAKENDNICKCGNFKKSEYKECYICSQSDKKEDEEDDEIDPDDIPF